MTDRSACEIRPPTLPPARALLDAAFGEARFEKTCERLREGRLPALSLVAQDEAGRLVGTVRLWNVSAGPGRAALLLGPLAVDGALRSQGLGGRHDARRAEPPLPSWATRRCCWSATRRITSASAFRRR